MTAITRMGTPNGTSSIPLAKLDYSYVETFNYMEDYLEDWDDYSYV